MSQPILPTMPQERQLAAIMFTDIVGYTKLMGQSEQRAMDALARNRAVQLPLIAKYNGRFIKELGDGTMASFSTAYDAVRCAIAMQQGTKDDAELNLRIGIHLGEVVFENNDVFGDGVNVAARIESAGRPGAVFISGSVQSNMHNKDDIETRFVERMQLKNVAQPIDIHEVAVDGKFSEAPPKVKSTASRTPLLIGALVVIVAVVAAVALFTGRNTVTDVVMGPTSIAVLPFVNMSSDADQEYFSDGLTEDIITQLAKITELHVISRTSCMKYKGDTLSIKEIGAQLSVSTILEGSVQRAGDQLRITAQLIDVATDAHLWAESYDRPVQDLFAIQREIAVASAGMLKRTLTPDHEAQLAVVPTENIAAYQAYLKGRHLAHQAHVDGETALRSIVDLEQAVALDSTFAMAYAELARSHARVYYLRTDRTEERIAMATRAAAKALRLGADQPEVHLAVGDYYNWAMRDRDKAMEHWTIAEKGLPNNSEVLLSRGGVMMVEGRMEECIGTLKKATIVSPNDARAFSDLSWAFMWAHLFPEAIAAADKAITLTPDQNWPYLYRCINYFCWKGPVPEVRAAAASVEADYPWRWWVLYLVEVADGNIDEALRMAAALPDGWDIRKTEVAPAALFEAYLHQHLGDAALAKRKYTEAVALLEKELPTHAEDARYHSALGMALAGAGHKDRAIATAIKATELMSYAKDAGYGINPIYDLAVTYTLVGEFDKAFEQLDFNLGHPGYFTVEWLKGDVRFDALRKDPRYAALLKKYAL